MRMLRVAKRPVSLAVSYLLLAGCASQTKSDLIVFDARLSQESQHAALQQAIAKSAPRRIDENFVLAGHRISGGSGVVLAIREFSSGSLLRTDRAAFRKLTIYLPQTNLRGRINLAEIDGVVAYWSSGSSAMPGKSGCYGYARSGTLDVAGETKDTVTVSISATFDSYSPAGWDKECESYSVQETATFVKRNVQDLTPWEGRAGEHISDEAFH